MNWDEIKNFPAYICTTKDSTRTEFALAELNKVNIANVQIVYGINGSSKEGELEIEEKAKACHIDLKQFIRYGEAALAIAFYEALNSFLETENPYMLWFEDDIILHHDYVNILGSIDAFKNWKEFSVVYLGSSFASNDKSIPVSRLMKNEYWMDCTDQTIWGTHAIVISREFAKLLIANVQDITAIDMYMSKVFKKNKSLLKVATLLFPLELKNGQTWNWEEMYAVHRIPPTKELEQLLRNYRRNFGELHPCWGLFFQKHTPSILKAQTQYKSIKTKELKNKCLH
jgi:GR25 family glycosyltransferase involved in LPS biosynthesis